MVSKNVKIGLGIAGAFVALAVLSAPRGEESVISGGEGFSLPFSNNGLRDASNNGLRDAAGGTSEPTGSVFNFNLGEDSSGPTEINSTGTSSPTGSGGGSSTSPTATEKFLKQSLPSGIRNQPVSNVRNNMSSLRSPFFSRSQKQGSSGLFGGLV